MFSKKFQKIVLATVATATFVVPTTSAFASTAAQAPVSVVVESSSAVLAKQLLEVQARHTFKTQNVTTEIKLKTLAAIVRAGGWALEVLLKPFSKKAADAVLKYRTKIADALDALESWGKSKFVNLLVRFGVPQDVAESIAEVVAFLVL
ncbi:MULTISPECIES: hypothetical protein [Paenibacillus]|uniref:Uncharacterized protein n=1 Tax=Paenibacillus oleatilyticus TaxID=2594886 RepID=A0ABV4UYV9_9BACL|nr:hypothetical protein [Paenibacillus sp. A3]KPV56508.1 hypothetical protein QJ48_27275 [Paenibacillus sp. A3]